VAADAPVKDDTKAHPIAAAWRPVFEAIVRSLTRHDYRLAGIESVKPLSAKDADFIRDSIDAYGGVTLIELPEETWKTSVAQWMGTHWETLVDLWTAEEGRSDLVLGARVRQTGSGFMFEVEMVYVP
jgi:hypothetical protein